jgi:hypothetical protein
VVLLASHLESGRLADFWALAQGSRDVMALGGWLLGGGRGWWGVSGMV